jgi:hypothetical protein
MEPWMAAANRRRMPNGSGSGATVGLVVAQLLPSLDQGREHGCGVWPIPWAWGPAHERGRHGPAANAVPEVEIVGRGAQRDRPLRPLCQVVEPWSRPGNWSERWSTASSGALPWRACQQPSAWMA